MLFNFIKVAFRNLSKNGFYSSINIIGLALGMAVCMMIGFYVVDELSYDKFHTNSHRIYRVITDISFGDSEFKGSFTSPGLLKPVVDELPEIEAGTRMDFFYDQIITVEDKSVLEPSTLSTDPGFLTLFDFELLQGNAETALNEPFSAIVTPESADRIYGTHDVIGKTFTLGDQEYKINGLIDPAPGNSHFHFGIIISLNSLPKDKVTHWGALSVHSYLLLKENTDIDAFESKLNGLLPKYFADYDEFMANNGNYTMYLQNIEDIHLYSDFGMEIEPGGSINYIYIFTAIALFIILLACINFMNMATARSVHRAKEVGIRKVMGSNRSILIGQFLSEALVMSFIAAILAIGLLELGKGQFNAISGKELSMNLFENPTYMLIVIALAIVVGIVAGSYPAMYLTSFQPASVLKGSFKSGRGSLLFRNALVVVQFVVSVTLIICTLIVNKQLQFMSEKKLGFDKENVLIVNNIEKLKENRQSFLDNLKALSAVVNVSQSNFKPFSSMDGTYFSAINRESEGQIINYQSVGNDYITTMGITLVNGREFTEEFTDTAAVIINQSAVARLGLNEPVVGQDIIMNGDITVKIVGIVEDFHFRSLQNVIDPLVIVKARNYNFPGVAIIRIQPGNYHDIISRVEAEWEKINQDTPFQYSFVEKDFDALFKSERKLSSLFVSFTGMPIFIACLGLFALSAFMAEQRTKEIGVRKVLGASTEQLVFMLSNEFTRLIVISIAIAIPMAYFLMDHWLADFAYRTRISPIIYIIAAAISISLACITVSYQSIKAAKANPATTLKSE